ncbi:Jag N-terminal domain-containing protein [Helicobacter ailurogastricus]|uniref:Jag N-terminal domain-containing protein n=1 Tax=Helicobacter ailurogastricus TaxID=1578720 RepID=UPI000CF19A02|nr:Jag N-terminal domain-containing protein [Helicobacter ailurogastricus]
MQTINAPSLEEAIIKASAVLGCSVVDLEYEVIQAPSKGFLGLGKKEAVIQVQKKPQQAQLAQNLEEQGESVKQADSSKQTVGLLSQSLQDTKLQEIQTELESLFSHLPYDIDQIAVSFYNPQTLLIEINGPDSALIIGEKGYRYNALSYLLFNWIHHKYNYNIRLEVASFLKDQEEIMEVYLQGVVMAVHEVGKAQTKPLDGMLLHIALKRLRETFPHKHVGIEQNSQNESVVVVND